MRSRTLRANLRRHLLLFLTAMPIAVALLLGVFAVPQLVALLDRMGNWDALNWISYLLAACALPVAWLAVGFWLHARSRGRAGRSLAIMTAVLMVPSITASALTLSGLIG